MKIVSWNCKNFKTNGMWLQMNFDDCDIILLQETWLFKFEDNIMTNVFKDYHCISSTPMTPNKPLRGRPFGGTAVLIHNRHYNSIVATIDNDCRLLQLKINTTIGELLIINAYFPCNNSQNDKLITYYLGKLESILRDHDGPVICAGDFNISNESAKYDELLKICEENDLCVNDSQFLNEESYTFISNNNLQKSWIDHCFSTSGVIQSVSIPYPLSASDHLPLVMEVQNIISHPFSKRLLFVQQSSGTN